MSLNQILGKKNGMGNAQDICVEGGPEREIIRCWRGSCSLCVGQVGEAQGPVHRPRR
jgi:hypothetical protein